MNQDSLSPNPIRRTAIRRHHRKTGWTAVTLGLILLTFAAALALPLARGESPIDFGLDLAGGVIVTYRPDFEKRLERFAGTPEEELLALAKETLKSRLYRSLDTVPDVVIRDDRALVVSLPGHGDTQRVLDLVGQTYHLTLRPVLAEHDRPTPGVDLYPYQGRYLQLAPTAFSGDMLDERAIRVETDGGQDFDLSAGVSFRFRPPHNQDFAEFTGRHVGSQLAILLDDRVEWAGTISSAIPDVGILSGGYSLEQATDIARMLRSGTLPISLEVESLSAVGPGLGQEIRERGGQALALSLGLLTLLVAAAYGHRGRLWIAGTLSLFCLLLLIAGMVAAFSLTLDLVGIAGLVLSIGMGMDAFIIIFEALEAERRQRPSRPASAERQAAETAGLLRRMYSFAGEGRTLFHANATTLVVILSLFATERLQSFAVFISVGILASLLTLAITRESLLRLDDRARETGGRQGILGGLRRARPGIFRWRKLYFAAVATGLLATGGLLLQDSPTGATLELGADFREGTQLVVASTPDGSVDAALDTLRARFPELEIRRQTFGAQDDGRVLLTLDRALDERVRADRAVAQEEAEPNRLTPAVLNQIFAAESAEIESLGSIDDRVSSRRLIGSLSILLFSFFFLAVYFAVLQGPIDRWFAPRLSRRRRAATAGSSTRLLAFAGVLVAVVIDLVVVVAALTLLKIPISLPVIAAFLTIVGYSVNDSVVLWSHVQNREAELRAQGRTGSPTRVVTAGVDRILSRALLTSLSTLVPALAILGVGLEPLHDFAWTMIVGTVAGTLSSIFVVGSFAVRALDSLADLPATAGKSQELRRPAVA